MKYIFYVTFTSGLERAVRKLLFKNLKRPLILNIFDGAILFEYNTIVKVTKLKCFNNIFIALSIMKDNNTTSQKHVIQSLLKNVTKDLNLKFRQNTFKVSYVDKNILSTMNDRARNEVNRFIIKHFHLCSEKSSQNFEEFWILKRSEGLHLFLYRISKSRKRKLFKGELRPELAHTIVSISNPNKNDIFLDPFAGYGGLTNDMAKSPFQKLYISDINQECTKIITSKIKSIVPNRTSDIEIICSDFLTAKLPKNTFTKIVTDPPWGMFEEIDDLQEFYFKILQKFFLILKKDGITVLLVSREINIPEILNQHNIPLECIEEFEILLSGRKASIYKLKKTTN